MAFGRTDTDVLYGRVILPLLRQRRVTAFRVDRSVRNEDIDDQILEGLQRCDLVVADLTYARPSVYFEAGVAHGREVPVIFTCRGDHLRPQPEDPEGNRRVHFDLQMKPIIAWDTPGDVRFSKSLAKRIDHVTRPLFKRKEAAALDRQRAAVFAPLPVQAKIERLKSIYKAACKRHGYRISTKDDSAFVVQPRSKHLQWCHAHVCNTLSKTDLRTRVHSWYPRAIDSILQDSFEAGTLPRRVGKTFVFCSLQRVPARRVAAAFPTCSIHADKCLVLAKRYTSTEVVRYVEARGRRSLYGGRRTATVPTDLTIAVISGLKHPQEFDMTLNRLFADSTDYFRKPRVRNSRIPGHSLTD